MVKWVDYLCGVRGVWNNVSVSFRDSKKSEPQTKELTKINTAVDTRQQYAHNGGGRVVVRDVLMEKWGITYNGGGRRKSIELDR